MNNRRVRILPARIYFFWSWGNIVSKLWKFPFQWCTICCQSLNCDLVINIAKLANRDVNDTIFFAIRVRPHFGLFGFFLCHSTFVLFDPMLFRPLDIFNLLTLRSHVISNFELFVLGDFDSRTFRLHVNWPLHYSIVCYFVLLTFHH